MCDSESSILIRPFSVTSGTARALTLENRIIYFYCMSEGMDFSQTYPDVTRTSYKYLLTKWIPFISFSFILIEKKDL